MVIYGEYLFIENFISGLILLLLTAKLTGSVTGKFRILAGAVICGMSSFIIFVPLSGIQSAAVRAAICFCCILVTFGRRELLKEAGVFMALTLLWGGGVMALLLWQQQPAITHQGIVYMDAFNYIRVLCFGILALGFTYWFVKLIRRRKADVCAKGKVRLVIDGKNYVFRGFADSGNCLKEPMTGKPVVLLDERGASRLPFEAADFPQRYRVIPFKAVGVDEGSLDGLRCDAIIFEDRSIEGAYIAFYRGLFGEFEALINREFLEGGLLQNV